MASRGRNKVPFSLDKFHFYNGRTPAADYAQSETGSVHDGYGDTYLSNLTLPFHNDVEYVNAAPRHITNYYARETGFMSNGYGASGNKSSLTSNGYEPRENRFTPSGSEGSGHKTKSNRYDSSADDTASVASLDSAGKQKSFQRVLVRFAEKTSMQGVPYIYNAKLLWAKVAWAIMTILAIAAMIAHLYYLIDQYYSHPKQTKITLGFGNLRFPDVTICNTNTMKQSALYELKDVRELKEVVAYLSPTNLAPNVRNSGSPTGDTNGSGDMTGTGTGGDIGDTTADKSASDTGDASGSSTRTDTSGTNSGSDPASTGGSSTDSDSGDKTDGSNTGVGTDVTGGDSIGGNTGVTVSYSSGSDPASTSGGSTVDDTGNKNDDSNTGMGTGMTSGDSTDDNTWAIDGGTTSGYTGDTGVGSDMTSGGSTGTGGKNNGTTDINTRPTSGGITDSDNGNKIDGSNAGEDTDMSSGRGTGGNTGDTSRPKVRRKRFSDKHSDFDFSQFDYNSKNDQHEDLNDDEYDGEIDISTEIFDLFETLYMNLNRTVRAEAGHNISDMLVSCTFNGRLCDSSSDSSKRQSMEIVGLSARLSSWLDPLGQKQQQEPALYFAHYYSGNVGGHDLQLHSHKLTYAGLKLVLYMETTEYLSGISNGFGARLTIHAPSTLPLPSEEGMFIPSSMETSIGMKMIMIERMGQPYGDCDEGDEFSQLYGMTYSRRACQAVCYVNMLLQECQCFERGYEHIAMKKNSDARQCRSDTEVSCMSNISRAFQEKEMGCTCYNPCTETQYEKYLSQRQWPSDAYADVLLQSVCDSNPSVCETLKEDDGRTLNNNFLKLNIYYEDLNFENITEEPEIEEAQFISDVGGAVGLWIGLSVLAFCEVFQLIFELLDYGVHILRKKQPNGMLNEKEKQRRRKEKLRLGSSNNSSGPVSWPYNRFNIHNEGNPYNGVSGFKRRGKDKDPFNIPRRNSFEF